MVSLLTGPIPLWNSSSHQILWLFCSLSSATKVVSLPLQTLTLCWGKGRLPSLFGFKPLPIPCPHELASSSVENTRGINFLRRCSAPFAWPPWTILRREVRLTNTSLLSSSLTVSLGVYKMNIDFPLDHKFCTINTPPPPNKFLLLIVNTSGHRSSSEPEKHLHLKWLQTAVSQCWTSTFPLPPPPTPLLCQLYKSNNNVAWENRCRFAGEPVVAPRNDVCFLRLTITKT